MITLALPFTVTPSSVGALTSDLLRRVSRAEPSQLAQAVARGLGLQEEAELGRAARTKSTVTTDATAFRTYLAATGVDATERHFLEAAAGIALRLAARREPRLTNEGIESFAFGAEAKELVAGRQALSSPEGRGHFLRAIALLSQTKRTKRVGRRVRSYSLKHMAEWMPCTFPGGEPLGPGPVSNGAIIAAAIHLGFDYEAMCDCFGGGSPNAFLNIDKGSLNQIEADIRRSHSRSH